MPRCPSCESNSTLSRMGPLRINDRTIGTMNLTEKALSGVLTDPFQYTACEADAETGLYYYRARYYDSNSGRFLNEDPVGFQGGINSYRYVLNDPTDITDPSGLCPRKKCDAPFPSKNPTTARLAQLVFAEGNGTPVGDLAIASVVVNDANYGNPREFGNGIIGVINKKFAATGNALFNSVSTADKVGNLNADNCQRYKNALSAAIAAQAPGGTNTDALFYFDITIGAPPWMRAAIQAGYVIPAAVPGGAGPGANYLFAPKGSYGTD